MHWLANLVLAFVTIVRFAIPIVVGFIVFGFVYNIVWPIVVGAHLGNMMALMFSGALGIIAGYFLAGICWR